MHLTSPKVHEALSEQSVLCLPVGAIEQHGPHLPLNTDVILAEEYTKRFVERWGEEFDLWQLPAIAVGLSMEHAWADGTMSLSVEGFSSYLRELTKAYANAFPARRMAIVNGHGGNRGILEALIYELEGEYGFRTCVIHPSALSRTRSNATVPEVHAGKSETSVMLVLAPELVRMDRLENYPSAQFGSEIGRLILDRGVTWAWSSCEPGIGTDGTIGDAREASRELGLEIIENAIANASEVFTRLTS